MFADFTNFTTEIDQAEAAMQINYKFYYKALVRISCENMPVKRIVTNL